MHSHSKPQRRARLAVIAVIAAALLIAAIPAGAQGDSPPVSARINGLIHTYQTWNNCGPANLTMALSYYGWGHDQSVAASYLKPNIEDKNVSPGQMAAYVNQQQSELGVRALWRYGGSLDLIKRAVAAGFPVIIESGYDVDNLDWMGHYETVVAYDDSTQTIWVYDSYLGLGDNSLGMSHSYAEFDAWWRHFNRAWILIFPLDRQDEVRAVLGDYADPAYAANRALETARAEATANPEDGWAWFNAGTSAVKLGHYADAAIYFDEAFRWGLPYRLMWYMFGPYEAYYNVGRYQDMLTLADNTEETTEYVEEIFYWRGMALAALGRIDEARAQYDRALAFNRYFTEAQTAKDQLVSQ